MPLKDIEKRREQGRIRMAEYRASNPEVVEKQRVRDRIRWANMTPDQRKRKEAQRSRESRDQRNAHMRDYLAVPENNERINADRRKRRQERIESGDSSLLEMHRAACQRYESAHRGEVVHHARKVLATAKHRSHAKHKVPYDLTLEWYMEQYEKGCAVLHIPFDPHLTKSPWHPQIDRVVPSLGYVQTNCRLVVAIYNQAKREWKDEDVMKMAKLLTTNLTSSDQ